MCFTEKLFIDILKEYQKIFTQIKYCDCGQQKAFIVFDGEDRWRCRKKISRKQKDLKTGTWLEGTYLNYQQVIVFCTVSQSLFFDQIS